MKAGRGIWVLASVLITTLILFLKEWETLAQLNTTLFGDYHDALKNYYTVLYHIKWDESYWWFEGMNYPYGDHVLFTDNQPLLSTILKFIHQNLFPVAGYGIGIINGLMFLSIILTTLFCHLALHKLKAKPWLALVVAVALAYLSPQIPRINAHYALSYSFIIPLLLYQGLLFLEKPHILRSVYIALMIIGASFLHAYYFGFGLVIFGGLFLAGLFYRDTPFKTKFLHFGLQVILPLVVVQLIMITSDPIGDRPAYPWSPFINNYKPHGIFFPVGKPMGTWINENFGLPQVDWESVTYVGAFASILFLLSLALLPFLVWFRKGRRILPFINPEQKLNFLLAAGLASFLIPVLFSVLSADPDFWEMMGPFRQFRAVTRFNWVFFFAINFYLFAWLSKKLHKLRAPVAILIALPILGILVYDAYWQSQAPFHSAYQYALLDEGSAEQEKMEQRLAGYDAMIPLPYFHIGSEDFVQSAPAAEHYRNAMGISYASGLPMTAVMLSRTSLDQSLKSLAYTFLPLDTPAFAEQLRGKRVLLLVHKNQNLSPQEQMLAMAGTDIVHVGEDYYLQEFDLDQYLELKEEKKPAEKVVMIDSETKGTQKLRKESLNTGRKAPLGGLGANPPKGPQKLLIYRNYEEDQTHAYIGKGSKSISPDEPRLLERFELSIADTSKLQIGMWVYLYESTKAIESFRLRFLDGQGTELAPAERHHIRNSLKVLDDKWGYVEITTDPPAQDFTLEITQFRHGLHPTETYVDGLRIEAVGGLHE